MDTSHGAAMQISVFIVSNVRLHRDGLVDVHRRGQAVAKLRTLTGERFSVG